MLADALNVRTQDRLVNSGIVTVYKQIITEPP
jgi:hypothetical protein